MDLLFIFVVVTCTLLGWKLKTTFDKIKNKIFKGLTKLKFK